MAKAWFKDRLNDHYLQKSRLDDYRSRAAYKLEEIDQKYKLIKPGQKILDLGAAPGSWTQYALRKVNGKAKIIAIDLLEIAPVEGAIIIKGDIRDAANQARITELAPHGLDLILSDMAPDTTGVHFADTENSALLVHLALDIVEKLLKPGGCFVAKVFEGAEYQQLLQRARKMFDFAKSFNPKASLTRSREIFLVAQNYQPKK
ncbi:MAG TPA: RlmE family RNA methyltransferase [Candidatus Rifleibacterium sp.]|nr:RlmE family RNA methyltransferase [Candidatus Rifleibacterium sp.]HPT47177.1 RlmE family RNA methyltransferase [Candidatus Rifleibacterium sp.]